MPDHVRFVFSPDLLSSLEKSNRVENLVNDQVEEESTNPLAQDEEGVPEVMADPTSAAAAAEEKCLRTKLATTEDIFAVSRCASEASFVSSTTNLGAEDAKSVEDKEQLDVKLGELLRINSFKIQARRSKFTMTPKNDDEDADMIFTAASTAGMLRRETFFAFLLR